MRSFSFLRARGALVLGLTSLALSAACSAGSDNPSGGGDAGANSNAGGSTNQGASGAQGGNANTGGSGAGFVTGTGGTGGGGGGVIMNPCGSECGPTEICDDGLDNNCDGEADENCPCNAGQSSSCFKGDPSYADAAGCFPGTMQCTENGTWGPCQGGSHASEMCFSADPLGCHPVSAVPFQSTDLRTGTGNFDDNAMSDSFSVACPPGVNPCPAPSGSSFQALQSGEYTVTYTKTVNGMDETCTFPLYVGARGLRVELSWNHPSDGTATDLDLHLHQPMSTQPFDTGGAPQDCGFANCKAFSFFFPFGDQPEWFPPNNVAPDPVNWFDSPNDQEDLCYYAPQGAGADWQMQAMGCHSPRLDLDNISCDPTINDPNDFSFCAPENINVDFPPKDQWMRVGVHYYPGTSSFTGTTLPDVKIFCDGKQAAELGTFGYNNEMMPVAWSGASDQDKMWIVADVLFRETECKKECIVMPIYADDVNKTPLIVTTGETVFAPPYPPIP